MLVDAYGDHTLSEATCRGWFPQFRNKDFIVRKEEPGRPPYSLKFEGTELQTILTE